MSERHPSLFIKSLKNLVEISYMVVINIPVLTFFQVFPNVVSDLQCTITPRSSHGPNLKEVVQTSHFYMVHRHSRTPQINPSSLQSLSPLIWFTYCTEKHLWQVSPDGPLTLLLKGPSEAQYFTTKLHGPEIVCRGVEAWNMRTSAVHPRTRSEHICVQVKRHCEPILPTPPQHKNKKTIIWIWMKIRIRI